MNFYPRSMLHNLARSSMSMASSRQYGLRSYRNMTNSTTTPKLLLKKSSNTSSSNRSDNSLQKLYKDQLTEQARADVRAGVSMEDGRKRASQATPLLKYLSSLGGTKFQKEINEIYDEAYQTAKAELDAGTLDKNPKLDLKV